MTNLKSSLPVLLALVIALAGSFFLYQWMQTQASAKEVVEVKAKTEAIPVCVASADLAWGTQITAEMVKVVPFLKQSLPTGYFTKPEDLLSRVIISPLKSNDPIIEHRLAPKDIKTGGVAAVVKPGKRAVAVKGDKVIGLSGFILPMSRVDVMVTLKQEHSKKEKTKVVLENILVLATGTQVQENEKGEPAPVDVYTLEVSPEEGEKLALAANKGKLQFALRNAIDAEEILTSGATVSDTLASYQKKKMKKVGKKWVPRRYTTVETIKGSDRSRAKLKL
jgi:pilus assembly protein CpaB